MAKASTATINLRGWCERPYRGAVEAILDIDLAIEAAPTDADSILGTAATALVLLDQAVGVVAPAWLPTVAKFHRLTIAERNRVRAAIDMRSRVISQAA